MKSFLTYLLEDNNTVNQNSASYKAIKILASALEAVKDRYIKCLSVLTLFDNQAGNIAELILVELLNEYSASHRDAIKCNLSATQEGGNQALTDISVKVDDEIINISLKNSALNNTIKLGTDTKEKSSSRITKTDMEDSAKTLTTLFNVSSKQSWQFPVFNTLEKLLNASQDEISNVYGFAEITARMIVEGLSENAQEMRKLVSDGIITIEEAGNGKLSGKSFCFTGELRSMKRADAEQLVKANGGSIKSSVTKDLSYLVTNDTSSGSSKNVKAAKFGIPVINEEEFLKLL